MTSEDASNLAVLVSTAFFALAVLVSGVGFWRRFRGPRRPAMGYLSGAVCLALLSIAAMAYAAWP